MSKANTVSVADFRENLPKLMREAEKGNVIHITRRGHPGCVLLSEDEWARLRKARPSPAEALAQWRATLDEDFEGFPTIERDNSPGRKVTFG